MFLLICFYLSPNCLITDLRCASSSTNLWTFVRDWQKLNSHSRINLIKRFVKNNFPIKIVQVHPLRWTGVFVSLTCLFWLGMDVSGSDNFSLAHCQKRTRRHARMHLFNNEKRKARGLNQFHNCTSAVPLVVTHICSASSHTDSHALPG